jgi:hypothetical protein
MPLAFDIHHSPCTQGFPMNLTLWIPAMIGLGLITLALMFAFVAACEKV